jgi:hypothetical protein
MTIPVVVALIAAYPLRRSLAILPFVPTYSFYNHFSN